MKLPQPILDNFSGDPLEWLEWSGHFPTTVNQHLAEDGMERICLKSIVTGSAKAAVEGTGYNAGTYRIGEDFLETGRPELVVNSQLKRLHSYRFIKPHDTAEMINFSFFLNLCTRSEPVRL